MEKCSMCSGLSVVPKYWWSDYFITKTCPVCNGSGQARIPQPELSLPLKPAVTPPEKRGDIVAGVEFMLAALGDKS